MDIYSLLVR